MYSLGSSDKMQDAPAVKFIKKAMENKNIVKGFLCHALWLLTPIPEVLRGRIVVCHTVVLADIINAGAKFIGDILLVDAKCEFSDDYHIVIDDDMVTGRLITVE
ncbi:DJ-1/PfpI family protein [Butyrivibrio sp. NC3005]|uniref:DJ-1/PfpI family protein n=1 Tax=Butyrivibrio sp. NC3005 TaxID=1280685 RepID=UPI00041C6961|nr:DJ-1/PfpI family protein [Butyrivibrio sp. NC3005]